MHLNSVELCNYKIPNTFCLPAKKTALQVCIVFLLELNPKLFVFLSFFLNKCRLSDSADQNASRTSRRSVTQERQDGPKHSERHQERSWQWWEYIKCYHIINNLFYCCRSNKHPLFQDNALEFEKRRNIPVKYNRELWDKTGNVYIYFSHVHAVKMCSHLIFELAKKNVTSNFYSGGNEAGGGNKTETTGKIYHEQVSDHSWAYRLQLSSNVFI